MNRSTSILGGKAAILEARPDKIEARVEVESRQVSGLRSEATVRGFTVGVDMPESFAGANSAPRPGEIVLAALAACLEITYRLHAEHIGIPLQGISTRVTGVTDARGFLPDSHGIRPGFRNVEVTILLDTPASDDDIARLKRTVEAHCPVLDDLRSPIPVHLTTQKMGSQSNCQSSSE